MKIKNIKIKDFRLFNANSDFNVDFKQVNLFYGFNGSGKTTFSTFFDYLSNKQNQNDEIIQSNFELKLFDNKTINKNNISDIENKIVVFNNEFISSNIEWNKKLKRIYIADKNIQNNSDLLNKEKEKQKLNETFKNNTLIIQEKEKLFKTSDINTILKDYKTKFINDDAFKEFINNIRDIDFKLKEDQLNSYKNLLTKEYKKLNNLEILLPLNSKKINDINNNIILKSIDRIIINDLEVDIEAKNWVESGIRLHKEKEICYFCGGLINKERREILSKYFNDNYIKVKNDINKNIENLNEEKKNIILKLIKDFKDYKEQLIDNLKKESHKIIFQLICELNIYRKKIIDNTVSKLNFKLTNLDQKETILFDETIINKINKLISDFNDNIVNRHNDFCTKLTKHQSDAKEEIKLHFCNKLSKKQEYNEYLKLKEENKSISNQLKDIDNEIFNIKNDLNLNNLAIENINSNIKKIISDDLEIKESVDDNKIRIFQLIRNGKIAKNLSDGEKTVIAISYFLTLIDSDDKKEKIIIIDDPISSLDNLFLYNIITILSKKFESKKQFGQLFLLTHNFYFFIKIRNIFKNIYKNNTENNGKNNDESLFGIFEIINKNKSICISEANKFLIDYNSEYIHIFKKINDIEDDNYDNYIILSNLIRRFLEIFLSFKCPSDSSLATKFSKILKKTNIEQEKFLSIEKLIQSDSHTQENIDVEGNADYYSLENLSLLKKNFFEILEHIDPNHFCELKKLINNN